jgi:fatty acid desaturase
MEIDSGRRREGVMGADPVVPLEIRLRRLHQRRRRAAMRRLMRVAFWSAGAIGLAAFALALGNAAPK